MHWSNVVRKCIARSSVQMCVELLSALIHWEALKQTQLSDADKVIMFCFFFAGRSL